MKNIKNKILRLVFLSISLTTLNINSIEAKMHEYAQEVNRERETINFLTDNFVEFYENQAVENPILRDVSNYTPLIEWAQKFYLNHLRENEFQEIQEINHYIVLNKYIQFFCQTTVGIYEHIEEVNSNMEDLIFSFLNKVDETIEKININFLINDFLGFYQLEELQYPILTTFKNYVQPILRNYYEEHLAENSFSETCQLDPSLVLFSVIETFSTFVLSSDRYMVETSEGKHPFLQLIEALNPIQNRLNDYLTSVYP